MNRSHRLDRALFALALFFASTFIGGAGAAQQTATKAPPKTATKAATPVYEKGAFNPAIQKLPAGFKGHSIQDAISSAGPKPKGEFESTAEYEARIKQMTAAKGVLAFVYSDFGLDSVHPEYDADNQEFSLRTSEDEGGPWVNAKQDETMRSAIITRRVDELSESVVTNGFGASTKLTKMRFTFFGIVFTNRGAASGKRYITVPVDRTIASTVKEHIGTLFVCEPASAPAVFTGIHFFDPPTFDRPFDAIHTFNYLHVNLLSVWAFDKRTGTIFAKIDDY